MTQMTAMSAGILMALAMAAVPAFATAHADQIETAPPALQASKTDVLECPTVRNPDDRTSKHAAESCDPSARTAMPTGNPRPGHESGSVAGCPVPGGVADSTMARCNDTTPDPNSGSPNEGLDARAAVEAETFNGLTTGETEQPDGMASGPPVGAVASRNVAPGVDGPVGAGSMAMHPCYEQVQPAAVLSGVPSDCDSNGMHHDQPQRRKR